MIGSLKARVSLLSRDKNHVSYSGVKALDRLHLSVSSHVFRNAILSPPPSILKVIDVRSICVRKNS